MVKMEEPLHQKYAALLLSSLEQSCCRWPGILWRNCHPLKVFNHQSFLVHVGYNESFIIYGFSIYHYNLFYRKTLNTLIFCALVFHIAVRWISQLRIVTNALVSRHRWFLCTPNVPHPHSRSLCWKCGAL